MRFLGIGDWNDLGDMYLRMAASGHQVRVHIGDPRAHGIMAGMVERVDDWRACLPWIREAGRDGIIVFEDAKSGALHDRLRSEGYQVIGGGSLGAQLEGDRASGQQAMRAAGLRTAAVHAFQDYDQAIAFIRASPGRYVYKFNGDRFPSTHNYVGELPDGSDVISLLDHYRRSWRGSDRPSFILMQHVEGVEIGVGAYFNGEAFLDAVCLDWEHKRFFPGDLGELTGEMGTLVTYRGSQRLFEATLAPMQPMLRAAGYCGYINLNTIVNDAGIWPLEFTCRFGYPGFAILDALHDVSWAEILARLVHRDAVAIPTRPGWAVGVVLTVPPFPRFAPASDDGDGEDADEDPTARGLPISFRRPLDAEDNRNLHLAEVAMRDNRLVTSGVLGYLMVATGSGDTVERAQERAYALARTVVVPNLRYRDDIGRRFVARDQATLRRLGWLP
ncbi:MAG: phosphoribosylamine--glycine ligase [Planctomycetes bacterium]|nr:phosphoribosylamine--glycine ligase [Planctomycetota bacterium]